MKIKIWCQSWFHLQNTVQTLTFTKSEEDLVKPKCRKSSARKTYMSVAQCLTKSNTETCLFTVLTLFIFHVMFTDVNLVTYIWICLDRGRDISSICCNVIWPQYRCNVYNKEVCSNQSPLSFLLCPCLPHLPSSCSFSRRHRPPASPGPHND